MMNSVSRRQFCRSVVAGSAAVALGPACSGKKPKKNTFALRYALASSMYGKTKLARILPEVKKSGADSIDLWPIPHGNQREQLEEIGHELFAESLEAHGIRLGILTCYMSGPHGLAGEMVVAEKLGGTMLISGSAAGKDLEGAELKSAVRKFVDSMAPHVAEAEKHGITIGIENHSGQVLATPDAIRWFGEFAEARNLGVALAPYHLPQDPQLLANLVEELGPNLVHFYAWQHGKGCSKKLPKEEELEQMPGRGDLDFKPILEALKKIEYAGWTEVFMHPVPRGIPILEPTEKVTDEINRSRRYLDGIVTAI